MKPIRIVQLLPELNEGGVERGVVELNREFVARGLTSVVVSRGGRLVEQIEADGGAHEAFDVCSKNPLTAPWRILALRRLLRRLQPNIIHARSRVPAWLAYLANKPLRYPFVTTVHGLNSVSRYSEIMTRGDRVITVGEPIREHILKHYGVDPAKIRVIQRGVDLEYFDPSRLDAAFIAAFKDEYGLHGRFVVTAVGRITWLKDYESFIKSIALVAADIPQVTGLIVGGTRPDKQAYLAKLQALARDVGVADRVIFTGNQKRVAEIYALSDVVVNASVKMGNTGRTIVEAFALDRPVISTTYDGLDDLVIDGVNGYVIATRDPDDLAAKICRVHDGDFRNIRKNLNPEYTLGTMVDRTIATYQELL